VKNPVSNVTIATNTQQRQNLGETRIRGVQTDADYRFGTMWRVGGGYVFNQAKVVEFAANPALVGKFLPQVPEHRGSFHVAYINPRFATLTFAAQFIGLQYDDDANVRGVPANGCAVGSTSCATPGLPGFQLLDFTASRAFGRNFEAFFGVQNLADTEYYVGTNPTTIGSPRLVNGGIRLRFNGR
jgi:outer membrane receptor protein involved in Fe transport